MKHNYVHHSFFIVAVVLFITAFGIIPANRAMAKHSLTEVTLISPGPSIHKVKSCFSTVAYNGDYGFDLFIKEGGADSDRAVLAYLKGHLLSGADDISFSGSSFGCSTFAVKNDDSGYLFGRNFDWQNCNTMVVVTNPPKAYRSISTVNIDFIRSAMSMAAPESVLTIAALYAPLDGMNEKGLCVAVNMIEDSDTINQGTAKADLTTTTAIRLLLDKAATVDEALSLLRSYDMHSSFGYMVHFAIADADGRSVAVEYVHNIMKVIETPVMTNFYLAEGDKKGVGSSQSHTRYSILSKALAKNETMSVTEVRDALSSVSKRHFEEFLSTEWSVIYDQHNLTARFYLRENYNQSYLLSL